MDLLTLVTTSSALYGLVLIGQSIFNANQLRINRQLMADINNLRDHINPGWRQR